MKTREPGSDEVRPLPEEREAPEDRSTRRLLAFVLAILVVAAIGLLILLVWLLRPKGTAEETAVGGYPIEVVTTIYGSGSAADDLLRTPLGVAFDGSGNVWISNSGQARVEEYTSSGEFIRRIGEDGPGGLASPYGITVDPARGRVYVADYTASVIQIYTTEGGYVGHFPADDQNAKVFGPNGFSPYDVEIFHGRVVATSNDGIYFFNTDGHVVARWGGELHGRKILGSAWGQFTFPDAIAVDEAADRLYVADSMNRRIVALDASGKWLWASGRPDSKGRLLGFWQLPRGVAVGPDGNLYVVDTFRADDKGMGTGYIVELSTDGELLSEFGRTGTDDGDFNFPDHLATGPDGLWAIADRENNRVVIFRLHTPYPEVDDLLAGKYDPGLARPPSAFQTPTPEPIA
jgi:tripartite motif-containing protein 71